jgi:hypothetical protein
MDAIKLELGKVLIQTFAIVIGWIVVHWLSSKRDRDKSRRDIVGKALDGLGDDVTKFFSVAIKYHTNERDPSAEVIIKMTLQDIMARVNMLSDISHDETIIVLCMDALLQLKKTVTGKHFEDEHITSLSMTDSQVELIAADVLVVKQQFLQLKHRQYPKN